jgi:predicted nucleotidyltransferase component of viral defense system
MLSRDQLQRGAAEGGFQIESYEKIHMLVELLESIRGHPFLGRRMVLKGGTALNLFVLDFPPLSVDIDELAAGKLAALVARSASRDLFDACMLLRRSTLNPTKLRLGFVVYGGANREDWRSITIEHVATTVKMRANAQPPGRRGGPWQGSPWCDRAPGR